jgi:hypothetical protein
MLPVVVGMKIMCRCLESVWMLAVRLCIVYSYFEFKCTLEPSGSRPHFYKSNEDGKPTLNPKYEVTSNILI